MSGYWRHLCLSIALFAAAPLLAAETDPPGRVGRISLANEGTQLRIGDAVAIGVTALNWPLTTGALIETASASRTEARIGSTTLRISGGTSLELVELSDERIWLRLNRGSVVLRIQNPEHAAEMALDTPQGRLRVDAPGSYRADVAGGTTAFSAYQGTAHIEDFGLAVRAGDRVVLLGGTDRNYLLGQAESDAFRQWDLAREQLVVRGGNRYISPEMTGHEELERHGNWRETPEYGPAWFPQGMPLGWAPYRQGRWAWVSPWGWTWIDHAPWGFAPFHYGRWALIGSNWAWLPGAYVARPIYAPALIAWRGQPGRSASFSFSPAPAAGWLPLGPHEVYYPSYKSSLRHVRNINMTHVSNVSRIVTVSPPSTASLPPHFSRTHEKEDRKAETVWQGHPARSMQAAPPVQSVMPAAVTPPRDAFKPREAGSPPETQPRLPLKLATSAPASHDAIPVRTDKHKPTSFQPSPPDQQSAVKEQMQSRPRHVESTPAYQPAGVHASSPPRQTPASEPGHAAGSHADRPHHVPGSEKTKESGQREYTKPKHGRQDQ